MALIFTGQKILFWNLLVRVGGKLLGILLAFDWFIFFSTEKINENSRHTFFHKQRQAEFAKK